MRWPTIASWSDRRIGGLEVKLRINILERWHWKPFCANSGGLICLHWLCFWSWWSWTAEEARAKPRGWMGDRSGNPYGPFED